MATGNIIAVWNESADTLAAVTVSGVEYHGRVPTAELAALSAAEKKARLRDAVKAEYDRQNAPRRPPVGGITGTLSL